MLLPVLTPLSPPLRRFAVAQLVFYFHWTLLEDLRVDTQKSHCYTWFMNEAVNVVPETLQK